MCFVDFENYEKKNEKTVVNRVLKMSWKRIGESRRKLKASKEP
jgi:hypothetical protein